MTEIRQPGWYWVRRAGRDWEPAEWALRRVGTCHYAHWNAEWADTGTDADVDRVGPRIPTPDEPWQAVPMRITAESGHKAALIGEFKESVTLRCEHCDNGLDQFDQTCEKCDGAVEYSLMVPVSWTTIKAIHRRIVEIAAAPKPGGES